MSLKIYTLLFAVSDRVIWLCEELSEVIPTFKYELFVYARGLEDSEGKKALMGLHPSGTAPTMVDSTVDPPVTIAESGAIVDYIIHVHGKGHFSVGPSAGPQAYAQYLYWFNFAAGSFQPFLDANILSKALTQKGEPKQEDDFMTFIVFTFFKKRTTEHLNQLNTRLSQSKYLADGDDVTAADFMNIFAVTTFRAISPYDLTPYPNILRWLADVTSRPAYRRTMEKAERGVPPLIQPIVPQFPWEVLTGMVGWETVPSLAKE